MRGELAGPSPAPTLATVLFEPDDFDENYDVTPPQKYPGQRKRDDLRIPMARFEGGTSGRRRSG